MRGTKTKEEQAAPTIENNGVDPNESGMDDADAFIVERIAEAVVRKIDERDKINLLAEAVIARLQKLGKTPVPENEQAKAKEKKSWERSDFNGGDREKERGGERNPQGGDKIPARIPALGGDPGRGGGSVWSGDVRFGHGESDGKSE